MPAPKGNQFWKARTKIGRSKIFTSSTQLWDAACEYFEWVDENPLKESKICSFQGKNIIETVPLMRAMTVKGLCIFLGVNSKYFNDFSSNLNLDSKKDKAFSDVLLNIREIIDTQKFEGASAGLLNSNIIARDLGLADMKQLTGVDGGPIKTETTTFNFIPVGSDD